MIEVEVFGQRARISDGKWSLAKPKTPLADAVLEDLRVSTDTDLSRGRYGTTSQPDVDLMAARAAVSRMGGLIVDESKHEGVDMVRGKRDRRVF